MDYRNDVDKIDEVMLPGFRFHPTDEELVGFYLKRKIQQRPLSIELIIKQLDIYKYDPWDLPKFATTGEKEWYFYCPRDRKYRNSARPNRVTRAGFWKATGTDRPIYSSEGNKCIIGLKKSLVFYKGRAARGIKTEWMMHEFRLPSLTDSAPPKRFIDKTIPANDSWAICRIFKKTNSTAQRALSHSLVSPLPEPSTSPLLAKGSQVSSHQQFSSQNMPLTTETSSGIHLNYNNHEIQRSFVANLSALGFSTCKPMNNNSSPLASKLSQLPISNGDLTENFFLPPVGTLAHAAKCTVDASSVLLNMSSSMLGDFGDHKLASDECSTDFAGPQDEHCNGFSLTCLPQVMQANAGDNALIKNPNATHMDDQWETVRSIGLPFSLPVSVGDAWKPNLLWDSSSCPIEMSTNFSTN